MAKTQRDCYHEFKNWCRHSIVKIDQIDADTPADESGIEPRWWLKMMDLRKSMMDVLDNK